MKKAKERIEGSEIAQYARLRDYGNEILKTNPGSTVRIHTNPMPDSNPLFLSIYVCFDACKKGFVGGCRPLIGLDGTFLRGYYGGQLLTAIGQDANNHIYPIAYAIVESENKESWKWFLEILQEDVGNFQANRFNFMSDMQKEILENVQSCAKSTTTQDFNAAMDRLKKINVGAWEYLDKISPKQWSRAHFSEYPKADNYKNNNCEVFNAKVKKMRGKPIITMLEEVRCYVMRIMARNKKALVGYNGRHACAVLAYQNRRPEEYAHNWLTMGAYYTAYQCSMRPVPSQEFWEQLDTLPILPPRYRKSIGRPSYKRDKRNDAPPDKSDPHRTKRRIETIVCKYCLQAGHNKRSCKKRKAAMGGGSSAPQVPEGDSDDDMMAEMFWEETLEAADAEAAATEDGNDSATPHHAKAKAQLLGVDFIAGDEEGKVHSVDQKQVSQVGAVTQLRFDRNSWVWRPNQDRNLMVD
ncbi:uncharacterized protein [Arachis hypogaea]|uniref:uncharacterized protein n=1 Tax=Arachis hypogaea TaxID=3818 RepID=UPI000DEC8640|nr:uncharacterized protein LOC112698029 [Arachis hypogaea]